MNPKLIPDIPPSPLRHSISLYCLSDALRPLQNDELDDTSETASWALIPERQPEPLSYEVDLYPSYQSCIPEAVPIPSKHEISLFSFDDPSGPIPQMDSSLPLEIPFDQHPNSVLLNDPEENISASAGSSKESKGVVNRLKKLFRSRSPSTTHSRSDRHRKLRPSEAQSPTEGAPQENHSKAEESIPLATSNPILPQLVVAETPSVSLPQVKQEPQIPAVPNSLPSQVDQTLEECPKFRILLVGKSGVGKSSLVKSIFNVDPNKIDIAHDRAGEANIDREYMSFENHRFILHDSKGFEPGSEGNWKTVEAFLKARQQRELPGKIHSIWLCVETPLTGSRLLQTGDEGLLKLAKEFNIPIIAVFTKYDQLVTQFWIKDKTKSGQKRNDDAERNASDSFDHSVKLLQEGWAKLSWENIPCVKVSTKGPNATEMLKDLENETHRRLHTVGNQLQVLWVAAQQVNARRKVEVSISEGFKKYWLNLGQSSASEGHHRPQSSPFEGQILIDCVHRIHDDVLKVWNFNDPTKILSGTKFFTEMMGLVKPFIDRGAERIFSADFSSGYGPTGVTVVGHLLESGFGPQTIRYLCGNYQKYPSTAKLLSTYIINLIVVLYGVFTDILIQDSDPPRPLVNDVVFNVLTRIKTDLDTLDNIDSDPEFNTHPEEVIAKVINMQLLSE